MAATYRADALIARCQAWIADHYHEPSPVAAMVRLSGLAERSFKRRFQQATGMPPQNPTPEPRFFPFGSGRSVATTDETSTRSLSMDTYSA